MKPHLWLIKFVGVIVPRRLRANWRREWEAELRYREAMLAEWDRLDWRSKLDLLRRSASAFWDALWLQPKRLEDEMFQDLGFGVRLLLKHKGVTTVAVLSLALGIGANTALFSLVDPLLLRLLPVKNPEQLVVLKNVDELGEEHTDYFSYSDFKQLRERTQVFSGLFANGCADCAVEMVGPEPGSQAEKVKLNLVSGEYFEVLGVNALLGRTLTPADNQAPGAHPVAVLSHGFWQRRFGGDVSIIGKVIALKRQPFTIIGVAASEFFGAEVGKATDIWAPLLMSNVVLPHRAGLSEIDDEGLTIMARLRPGVPTEQAQAALDIFLAQLKSERNGLLLRSASKILLSPGRHGFAWFRTWISQPLRILMAVVGLVLLIACANVANLLLARAAARQKEVAIRLAVGARRFRLIRQFLTESALLAAAGAVLGLLFAGWGCRVILALMEEYDSAITIGSLGVLPNARALGFTLVVSLLATLLFGLVPALSATRQELNIALKATASPRSRLSLARSLVVAQVALSLLLLTGAGLFVQTLRNLRTRDFGFDAEHIIQGRISAEDAGYKKDQLPALYNRILERLNATPGVRSTTMSGVGFLYNVYGTCCIVVEGHTDRPDENRNIEYDNVRPGYFHAIGLPLLRGRDFTPQDFSRNPDEFPKVVIINETFARYYFGAANPLGKRIGWGNKQQSKFSYTSEIIGVVKDSVYSDIRGQARFLYFPAQTESLLVARAAGAPGPLLATIRREILAIDKNLVIDNLATSAQLLDENLFVERLLARLASFFSLLALLLSSVGLYGVMSYEVARRTHEIGIRMALGAQRSDVIGLVLRQTMRLVVIGVIIGLGAALLSTRWLTSLLYGLTRNDPLTIALASLLLLTVAALAGYLPARRAARVDPLVALRHE